MIHNLELQSFGKFKNKSFNFGPVTVFYGPNEAGKTTVYDALFYALCQPRQNRKAGKDLVTRYGQEGLSAIATGKEGFTVDTLDEEEFLNLMAIRASSLHIEFKSESSWKKRLMADLFGGGIDPSRIIRTLEPLASTRSNSKLMKKLSIEEEKEKSIRRELEKSLALRDSIRNHEEQLKDSAKNIALIQSEIEDLTKKLKKLEEQSKRNDLARERERMNSILRSSSAIIESRKELKDLSLYAENRLGEYDDLVKTREKWENELQTRKNTIRHLEEQKSKIIESLEQKNSTYKSASDLADIAIRLIPELRETESNPPMNTRMIWDRSRLVGSAIAALAGISITAALFTFPPEFFGGFSESLSMIVSLLPVAAGSGLSAFLASQARDVRMERDEEKIDQIVSRALDTWKVKTGRSMDVRSLSGVLLQLQEVDHEREATLRSLRETESQLARIEDDLRNNSKEMEISNESLVLSTAQSGQWLSKMGVPDRDRYIEMRSKFESIQKSIDGALMSLPQQFRDDPQAAHLEAQRRLAVLDEQGAPDSPISDADGRNLARMIEELRNQIDSKSKHLNSLERTSSTKDGELRTESSSVNRRILELERDLANTVPVVKSLRQERMAAEIALRIFQSIGKDSGSLLKELGKDLSQRFSGMLPEARSVRMDTLGEESILVQDAGGEFRQLSMLSSGTRDSFVLATRLSLARRSMKDRQGLLVLDDPFLMLDHDRERRALEMVDQFMNETGWQVILFTKDKQLKDLCAKIWEDSVIHTLN